MIRLGQLKDGETFCYNGVWYTKVRCLIGQSNQDNFSTVFNHITAIVSWMHNDCDIITIEQELDSCA